MSALETSSEQALSFFPRPFRNVAPPPPLTLHNSTPPIHLKIDFPGHACDGTVWEHVYR